MPRRKISDATKERRLDEAVAAALPIDNVTNQEEQRIGDAIALRLRVGGAQYSDIAKKLGYSGSSGAYAAVTRELRRRLEEPADELRAIEVARLDRMHSALWKYLVSATSEFSFVDKAVGRLLDIQRRRAALLGLDAPKKIDITTQIRAMAIQEGLDPDQAVRDAEMIIRQLDEAQA